MRPSVPPRKRAIVCSSLILVRPIPRTLEDTINCVEVTILLVSSIAIIDDTTYVDDGGDAVGNRLCRHPGATPALRVSTHFSKA